MRRLDQRRSMLILRPLFRRVPLTVEEIKPEPEPSSECQLFKRQERPRYLLWNVPENCNLIWWNRICIQTCARQWLYLSLSCEKNVYMS